MKRSSWQRCTRASVRTTWIRDQKTKTAPQPLKPYEVNDQQAPTATETSTHSIFYIHPHLLYANTTTTPLRSLTAYYALRINPRPQKHSITTFPTSSYAPCPLPTLETSTPTLSRSEHIQPTLMTWIRTMYTPKLLNTSNLLRNCPRKTKVLLSLQGKEIRYLIENNVVKQVPYSAAPPGHELKVLKWVL